MLAEWQKLGKQKLDLMEEEYINQTQLRALRLRQLEQLNQEGYAPRVPDGAAICDGTVSSSSSVKQSLLLRDDNSKNASTCAASSSSSSSSNYNANGTDNGTGSAEPVLKQLINPISCYICHKPYVELHFFYHQLCPDCSEFNYGKRDELADLRENLPRDRGSHEDRISFRAEAPSLRRHRHRDISLPQRRRGSLREREGQRYLDSAPARVRTGL
jgi:hypothetical protein